MKQKCIECGKVFGESGDIKNGSVTGSICLTCFIEYLEGKVKELENQPKRSFHLKFVRKLLTKKLIQGQEERR